MLVDIPEVLVEVDVSGLVDVLETEVVFSVDVGFEVVTVLATVVLVMGFVVGFVVVGIVFVVAWLENERGKSMYNFNFNKF